MKNRLTAFLYLIFSVCAVAQTNTATINWNKVDTDINPVDFVPRELFKINDTTLYLGCRYYLLRVSKDSLRIEFADKEKNEGHVVRSVVSYNDGLYISNQDNSVLSRMPDGSWVNILDGETTQGNINWEMIEYKSQLIYTSWPRWISTYNFSSQTWTSSNMLDTRGAGFISDFTKTPTDLFVSLYAGGVFKKDRNSDDWLSCNKGLPANLNVRSIVSAENKLMFAATEDGVYYSKLKSFNWKPCQQTQNKNIKFVDLMYYKDVLYATGVNGEFLYSKDLGKTWKNIFINNATGYVLYSVEVIGEDMYFSADGQGKKPSGVFYIPVAEILK